MRLPRDAVILGAHGEERSDGGHEAPRLSGQDLVDLAMALKAIRDGHMPPAGQTPERYVINERLALLTGPESYGSWRSQQGG